MLKNKLLISFFGPSGAGKTTCYKYASEFLKNYGFEAYRVDIAYPLRRIQSFSYELFGKNCPGKSEEPENFKQDGTLLGFLAKHFEKNFEYSARKAIFEICGRCIDNYAIINTDCRNNTYQILKELGFIFVKVTADKNVLAKRLALRKDLTSFDYKANVEKYNIIQSAYIIDNSDTLENLEIKIKKILSDILQG